jgi:hypothetical protein
MAKKKQCQGITSKGKRCKTPAIDGKFCAVHQPKKHSAKEAPASSGLSRLERSGLIFAIGDAVINIAEKAAEHAPEIFDFIVQLDGNRFPTVPTLREALDRKDFEAFRRHIEPLEAQVERNAGAPEVPEDLALQLVEGIARYRYHLSAWYNTPDQGAKKR